MDVDRAFAEGLEVGRCVCWEDGCGEVGVPRVVYEGVFLGLWALGFFYVELWLGVVGFRAMFPGRFGVRSWGLACLRLAVWLV